jgi:hypothetical protein
MKKLAAFAMILSLGLFCAAGCGKPPAKTPGPGAPPVTEKAPADKAGDKAPAAPEKPADKPVDTKAPEKK